MKQTTEIFHENDLVRTSCRQEIVQAIINSPTPLSEEEIKTNITGNFDRTTYYRTFKILMAKGVIHKIVIDNINTDYKPYHQTRKNGTIFLLYLIIM